LIIAQRGKGLPLCNEAPKFPSVMVVERTTHSTKPAVFREVLEKLYPKTWADRGTVKLELFARSAAPGWKVWGNQAPAKVGGKAATLRV
jgi:N6-adenosine-specific RNA methylase IME4